MISRRFLAFPLAFVGGLLAAALASASSLAPASRWAFCAAVEIPAVGIGLWFVLGENLAAVPRILVRHAAREATRRAVTALVLLILALTAVNALLDGWHPRAVVALGIASVLNLVVLSGLLWLWRWIGIYGRADISAEARRHESVQPRQIKEYATTIYSDARDEYVALAAEVRRDQVLLRETRRYRLMQYVARFAALAHAEAKMQRAHRETAVAEDVAHQLQDEIRHSADADAPGQGVV